MLSRYNKSGFIPLDKNYSLKNNYLSGFTLIEVLITVAILSGGIIFLLRSFAACLSSTKFSQNIMLACLLAEEKHWEVEFDFDNALKMPAPEREVVQGKDFNWKYEVKGTNLSGLKELNLSILWEENSRQKEYSIDFFNYLSSKDARSQ